MQNPKMKIYYKRKAIELNRSTIALLGNPPYLSFIYDDPNERLIVLPAFEETLDTYEIPQYYWNSNRHCCRICRLPLFLTFQKKFGYTHDKSYIINGFYQELDGKQKLVVFNFEDTIEININEENTYGSE